MLELLEKSMVGSSATITISKITTQMELIICLFPLTIKQNEFFLFSFLFFPFIHLQSSQFSFQCCHRGRVQGMRRVCSPYQERYLQGPAYFQLNTTSSMSSGAARFSFVYSEITPQGTNCNSTKSIHVSNCCFQHLRPHVVEVYVDSIRKVPVEKYVYNLFFKAKITTSVLRILTIHYLNLKLSFYKFICM